MKTHKKGAKRALLDKVLIGRASTYSVFKFSSIHSWCFADIPSGPYLSPSWATLHKGPYNHYNCFILNFGKRMTMLKGSEWIESTKLKMSKDKILSYYNFVLQSRSTSFTQTWLFMESFLSSYLSSSILQSTDRLTKPVIDSWTCICAVLFIFAIQSQNILGN